MTPREVIAEALHRHHAFGGTGMRCEVCAEASELITEALESAGYAVMPIEPTEEMVKAAKKACGYEEVESFLKLLACLSGLDTHPLHLGARHNVET